MVFNDFLKQYKIFEKRTLERDELIAKRVLTEYEKKYELLYSITGNYIEDLLYNCFLSKNMKEGQFLLEIMNFYGFNYSASIHNAIYYLLGCERELVDLNVDPLLWPGMKKIEEDSGVYILSTNLGKIRVSKASKIFENSNSSYIFGRDLMGNCHERSFDFIKENRKDYRVILSYMPNFFRGGGHYHTYLESNTSILDIAANSYYTIKEDSELILNGRVIKKLDYYDIERKFCFLSRTIPELKSMKDNKLLTLSLYYDYQNTK